MVMRVNLLVSVQWLALVELSLNSIGPIAGTRCATAEAAPANAGIGSEIATWVALAPWEADHRAQSGSSAADQN